MQESFVPHLAKSHSVLVRKGRVALEFTEPLKAEDADEDGSKAECETEEPDSVHANFGRTNRKRRSDQLRWN